jgi:hypothetical protein
LKNNRYNYALKPAQVDKRLFFAMGEEEAVRHGMLGYLRADFGSDGRVFYSSWFDIQGHLKTPDFKAEFDELINSLRDDGDRPPFASRNNLKAFINTTPAMELESRGNGYTVETLNFSYYFRCFPLAGISDIYCFAYDNQWLLPELSGEHKMPEKCFSLLPSTGEIIIIDCGIAGYTPFSAGVTFDGRRDEVNRRNKELGVSRRQEEAMLCGSIFGWDVPAARPWNYDRNGVPRTNGAKKV